VGTAVTTQPGQRPVTTWVYKPEAASTVWSSWWWAVCRSIHVEPSINIGLINSITKLHLVGISTESSTQRNTPEDQNLSEARNVTLYRTVEAPPDRLLSHRMSLTPFLHSEQQTRGYWITTKPRRAAHKWVMWVTRHIYTYCTCCL